MVKPARFLSASGGDDAQDERAAADEELAQVEREIAPLMEQKRKLSNAWEQHSRERAAAEQQLTEERTKLAAETQLRHNIERAIQNCKLKIRQLESEEDIRREQESEATPHRQRRTHVTPLLTFPCLLLAALPVR